ncbi:MAG TPA: MoaD/ThiS family protein [Fimbriimonadaceae bacterium]|nr:MoaD/ThiS family protein [Fimbriimonadaceae bacterium]
MTVHVRYFAVLRERAGRERESVEIEPMTARELVDRLIRERGLGLPSPLIRIAVGGAFVEDGSVLADGDEIVLLPPVAGG